MNSILLPFDRSGLALSNLIPSETHDISAATARVIVLEHGAFFSSSLVVRRGSTGAVLDKGDDYGLVGFDAELSVICSSEIVGGFQILNEALVGEVIVTCQMVGGTEGSSNALVTQLRESVESLKTSTVPWSAIKELPLGYTPEEHGTSVLTDLTELEVLGARVDGMIQALIGSRVIPENISGLNKRIDRAMALLGAARTDINRLTVINSKTNEVLAINASLNDTLALVRETLSYISEDGTVDLFDMNESVNAAKDLSLSNKDLITALENALAILTDTVDALGPEGIITAVNANTELVTMLSRPRSPNVMIDVPHGGLIGVNLSISTGPFSGALGDTHKSTKYDVYSDHLMENLFYTFTSSTELLTHIVSDTLTTASIYYVVVTMEGEDSGWGYPSDPFVIRTVKSEEAVVIVGDEGQQVINSAAWSQDKVLVVGTNEGDTGVNGLLGVFDDKLNLLASANYGSTGDDKLNSVTKTDLNKLVAVGSSTSGGNGTMDGLVVVFDEGMNVTADLVLGGDGDEVLNDVTTDVAGNIYCVGESSTEGNLTGTSGYLLKLDSALANPVQKLLYTTDTTVFYSVIVGHNDNLFVVGVTDAVNGGVTSGLILELDSGLVVVASKVVTGTDQLRFTNISYDGTNYVVSGSTFVSGVSKPMVMILNTNLEEIATRGYETGHGGSFNTSLTDTDGTIVAIGSLEGAGVGSYDSLLVSLTSGLEVSNLKLLGGQGPDSLNCMVSPATNDFKAFGYTGSRYLGGNNGLGIQLDSSASVSPGIIPELPSLYFGNVGVAEFTPLLTFADIILTSDDVVLTTISVTFTHTEVSLLLSHSYY